MRQETNRTAVRTAHLTIVTMTGQEGPQHDPYDYQRTVVASKDDEEVLLLHEGLGTYAQLRFYEAFVTLPLERGYNEFELIVGVSFKAFQRAQARLGSRCATCGGRAHHEVSGMIGESLTVCANGHVMACDFNISSVI